MPPRQATCSRETKETKIELSLILDGNGQYDIDTGIGFFDHMLEVFAKHGLLDLTVKARGDIEVDEHHTVEDVGIVLGKAVKEALADKRGIRRFGEATVPLDEARTRAIIDLNGRPFMDFKWAEMVPSASGSFDVTLVEDFARAFATNALATVHIDVERGTNGHHVAETVFKALGVALDRASSLDDRRSDVPSTKGSI